MKHFAKTTELELRTLVNSIPLLAWSALADGSIDFLNERWYEYTGADPSATPNDAWLTVHHPTRRATVLEEWSRCLSTAVEFDMEFPLRRADGVYRWFISRVIPIISGGRVTRWFGTNTDIDDQKQRTREALLLAEVASALALSGGVRESLNRCCTSAVAHLDLAGARIWTVRADQQLELRASAGAANAIDGWPTTLGLIAPAAIAEIARAGEPRIIRDPQPFAGYPLVVEERLVGVMATFGERPLSASAQRALQSVTRTIGLGIAHKEAEAAIRQSEQRYRFLADLVPSQVWRANPAGDLDYVNHRVLEYFGRTFDEMIGQGWQNVIHPEDLTGCVAKWAHSLSTGEKYEVEFRLLRASDGTYRWHVGQALPIHGPDGGIVKWFGTNVDTDDRIRNQQERERLLHALARSNEDLDQFAYVASHDLKAPLRGIASIARWVEDDLPPSADEARKNLALLRGRAQRLEGLIDGMLRYARATKGHDAPTPVAVGKLLTDLVDLVAPPPEVTITIGPGMPTLMTERAPLQQVFLNLVSNAIKHAGGHPEIRVEVHSDDGPGFYDFAVCDNGTGIDPRFHDRIWGIFQRLEARDDVEGTGIGLSIVQKIVEAHGGRVWIVSALGQGAAFHFTWPK